MSRNQFDDEPASESSSVSDENDSTEQPQQGNQEEFDEWVEENFTESEIFFFIPEYRGHLF